MIVLSVWMIAVFFVFYGIYRFKWACDSVDIVIRSLFSYRNIMILRGENYLKDGEDKKAHKLLSKLKAHTLDEMSVRLLGPNVDKYKKRAFLKFWVASEVSIVGDKKLWKDVLLTLDSEEKNNE